MARSGQFGRQPRAAPSLTATLLAIGREQENERDRNIMSAWQKGGEFEGQPVTDEVILNHWRERLTDISADDPLFDTYKNAVTQFEYSIAESKMTANYSKIPEPSGADDQAMIAFYLGWAEKVPKDSEFYRQLQRDAGQYIRAAKSKRAVSTKRAAEDQYNTQLANIERTMELPGQSALHVITMLAQRGSGGENAVLGESPLGGVGEIVNRTNIGDLQLPSIDELNGLLGTVSIESTPVAARLKGGTPGRQPPRTYAGNQEVLYHDESGAPVTGAAIVGMFQSFDPTFAGKFDLKYVNGLIAQQKSGLQQRITLAEQTGHASDMAQLQLQLAKVNEYGNEMAAWPLMQSYSDAKADLDKVMKNDSLLPAAKVAAIDRLRDQIGKLADDPRIAADDHLQSQLRGEAEGKEGTVTVSEDMQGFRGGFTTEQTAGNSEVMNITSIRDLLQEQMDLTSDPESGYVMTQGNYINDGAGGLMFQPTPGGKAVGAASMEDISNVPGAGPVITVMVPNGDGGGATPMALVPAPVMAKATKADGTPIGMSNKNPVAVFVRYKLNGREVTLYGLTDATSGATRWTNDPPWDTTRVKMQETNAGMVLDLSAIVPRTDTTGTAGGDMGGGFSVVGKRAPTGRAQGNAGKMVMDPGAATLGTDPTRARFDPATDSFSPTLISLRGTPDGVSLLQQYASDKRFRSVIDADARLASGMQFDAEVGWTGSPEQMAAYEKFSGLGNAELQKAVGPEVGTDVTRDNWREDTLFTKIRGAGAATVPGQAGRRAAGAPPGKLPTDQIRDMSPDGRFGGMIPAFKPGTNTILTPRQLPNQGSPTVKAGISLTLPSVAATPFLLQGQPASTVQQQTASYEPPSRLAQPRTKPYVPQKSSKPPTSASRAY